MRDYEVIKLKPSFLNPRATIVCNKNTFAWLIFGLKKGDYSFFFKNFAFNEALDYCKRAAIMKLNKRIDNYDIQV